MPCFSPLKGFVSRENGGLTFRRELSTGEKMAVSCGSCLGCRIDRSRMWGLRCAHEASLHEDNCFITLTYSDECIPPYWTLEKTHFRLFMKRLRKFIEPKKIKFYMCGEYGAKCMHIPIGSDATVKSCDRCNVGRPHYHAILFGHDFIDLYEVGSENGVIYYSSPTLEALWGLGQVQVGTVTLESCMYVARYITKKITGPMADDWYMRIGDYGECNWVEPEYCSMSTGNRTGAKGIAGEWYDKFKSDLWPRDEIPLPDSGVSKKVPRYFEEILRAEDPALFEAIKAMRRGFVERNAQEYSPERLEAKYRVKKAQVKMLRRNL